MSNVHTLLTTGHGARLVKRNWTDPEFRSNYKKSSANRASGLDVMVVKHEGNSSIVFVDARRRARQHEPVLERMLWVGDRDTYEAPVQALNDLSDLSGLQEDYNGYGSPAPSPGAILISAVVIMRLANARLRVERVIAHASGGVAIYLWSDTKQVCFGVYNDGEILVEGQRPGDWQELFYGNSNLTSIDEAIKGTSEYLGGA